MCENLPSGFVLLALSFGSTGTEQIPGFNESVRNPVLPATQGCVVYYSNRCPYAEYHVQNSLVETCQKRDIPLHVVKLETLEQAQAAPSPATIFSLFMDGQFVTTDLSACMDTRFDNLVRLAFIKKTVFQRDSPE